MIHREGALPAQPKWPLPVNDMASMHPCDRAPGRVTAGEDGQRGEAAGLQVPGDAGDLLAPRRPEREFERLAEWGGVDQSPKRRAGEAPAGDQPHAPVPDIAQQRSSIGAEDLLHGQVGPEPGEILDGARQGARVCRQERGIDGAGRHPGDQRKSEIRMTPRQSAQQSHLIGGAGASTVEHDGEIVPPRGRLDRR